MKFQAFLIMGSPVLGLSISCSHNPAPEPERPNIILILADDLGFSDISPFGSEISTPNLQKLADRGLIMTRFYNAARCCPSRASLLTGLYPQQAGMGAMADQAYNLPEYQGFLSETTPTIAEIFRINHYNCYMSGKWHVGNEEPHTPSFRGFDRSLAFLNGASSYYNINPYRDSSWIGIRGSVSLRMELDGENFIPPDSGWYSTDAYTDYALDFIRGNPADTPFFLYIAYTAPHWPLHAPEEDVKKYLGKYKEGWEVLREKRYRKQSELGILPPGAKLSPADSRYLNWSDFSEEDIIYYDRKMAVYAAMIDRMDQNIGRLLQLLDEMDISDNTLILFLSDNGADRTNEVPYTEQYNKTGPIGSPASFSGIGPGWANASNTPFREAKTQVFFGGIASPFIVCYPPRIPAGSRSDFQSHLIDILPSLMEIAGIQFPETFRGKKTIPLPGTSLAGCWKGEMKSGRNPLFFEHFGNRAVVDGEWKIVSFANKEWELYHLSDDPVELKNLADSDFEIQNVLVQKYEHWADSLNVLHPDSLKEHRITLELNKQIAK